MAEFLRQLFCNHEWVIDRHLHDKNMHQCYCKKCFKMSIRQSGGGIIH